MHIYIYKYKCKFCKYELYTYIQGKENVSIMLYMVSGYDTNIYTYIHIYIYIYIFQIFQENYMACSGLSMLQGQVTNKSKGATIASDIRHTQHGNALENRKFLAPLAT